MKITDIKDPKFLKKYNTQEKEIKWMNYWEENNIYNFDIIQKSK